MAPISDFVDLPGRERVPLSESPLVLALCEVKYGAILSVADSMYVAPFQRAILSDFPVAASPNQMQVSVALGAGPVQLQTRPGGTKWVFSDTEGAWKAILGEDSIVLETRQYASFDHFLKRLTVILTALEQHIHPTVVTRIGVRYINEIREPGAEWGEVLNPLVLGLAGEPGFAGQAASMEFLSQHQFRYPEQKGCNLTCGLLPRGTVLNDPKRGAALSKPFFVIDIDAFKEYQVGQCPSLEVDQISKQVEDFHQAIYSVFRWSVTDEYIEKRKAG
jgi:uncharacterized protein (TIGR04255 family)